MSNREHVQVKLVGNAGILLEFRETRILVDGIFHADGLPFSNPDLSVLQTDALEERTDFLIFTHEHPDHFSPELTLRYLSRHRVQGIFAPRPASPTLCRSLQEAAEQQNMPYRFLLDASERCVCPIGDGIVVSAFPTLHIDRQYWGVPHFCYLIDFEGTCILLTADVDYTVEKFERLKHTALNAVFVNPLFFDALRTKKFFSGTLQADMTCVYHIPFSEDDSSHMRMRLARQVCQIANPAQAHLEILCEHGQTLTV